jgi:hypothetical protein
MTSPLAQLYTLLQQHVANHLPEIKHIDQDFGQLKAARPAVAWPCLLIDIEALHCTPLAEQVQACTVVVTFRLGFAPLSNTTQHTPLTYTEKALHYYELEQQLYELLHGWSPSATFGKLTRQSTTTLRRNDTYRIREIGYTLTFEDYSARPTQRYALAGMVVQVHQGQ